MNGEMIEKDRGAQVALILTPLLLPPMGAQKLSIHLTVRRNLNLEQCHGEPLVDEPPRKWRCRVRDLLPSIPPPASSVVNSERYVVWDDKGTWGRAGVSWAATGSLRDGGGRIISFRILPPPIKY